MPNSRDAQGCGICRSGFRSLLGTRYKSATREARNQRQTKGDKMSKPRLQVTEETKDEFDVFLSRYNSLNDEMKEECLIFMEGFMMAFKLSGLDTVETDELDILDGYMDYSRRRLARPKVEDDQ